MTERTLRLATAVLALAGAAVAASSALGLVAYLTLVAAAGGRGDVARVVQAVVAVAGLLFSAYLLYVRLVVIGAICDWCLGSDALTAMLAAAAVLRMRAAVPNG